MATATKSARTRSHKQPTARKPAGKRAVRGRSAAATRAAKPKTKSTSASTRASARATSKPASKPKGDSSRFKKLAGALGAEWIKSAISSNHPALAGAVSEGLCVLQFSPRPDRMSWVSMTYGWDMHSRPNGMM